MPKQPSRSEHPKALVRSNTIRQSPSKNSSKQLLEALGSSGSGSNAGGNAQSNTGGDATVVTSTTSAAADIDAILSAWDQKTSEEQDAWCAEIFGDEGLPWKGEVAYDDEGDIEYEEKTAGGRR